ERVPGGANRACRLLPTTDPEPDVDGNARRLLSCGRAHSLVARIPRHTRPAPTRRTSIRAAVQRHPHARLASDATTRPCVGLPTRLGNRHAPPGTHRRAGRTAGDAFHLLPRLRAELLPHLFRVRGRRISLCVVVAKGQALSAWLVRARSALRP